MASENAAAQLYKHLMILNEIHLPGERYRPWAISLPAEKHMFLLSMDRKHVVVHEGGWRIFVEIWGCWLAGGEIQRRAVDRWLEHRANRAGQLVVRQERISRW